MMDEWQKGPIVPKLEKAFQRSLILAFLRAMEDKILNGFGDGEPVGVLNSPPVESDEEFLKACGIVNDFV